jgi:hypothetical protein
MSSQLSSVNATRMLTVGGVSAPGLPAELSCLGTGGIDAETAGTGIGGFASVVATTVVGA